MSLDSITENMAASRDRPGCAPVECRDTVGRPGIGFARRFGAVRNAVTASTKVEREP